MQVDLGIPSRRYGVFGALLNNCTRKKELNLFYMINKIDMRI